MYLDSAIQCITDTNYEIMKLYKQNHERYGSPIEAILPDAFGVPVPRTDIWTDDAGLMNLFDG